LQIFTKVSEKPAASFFREKSITHFAYSSTLKMDAICSSEILIPIYQSTWHQKTTFLRIRTLTENNEW
jgi:hypothetical protein